MKKFTLNYKGKIIKYDSPIVMGILNVTPDSFYDGGRFSSESEIIIQVAKMLNEGASIIDIGGMSTRPDATLIDADEEIKRILPVVKSIHTHFPDAILSIDTYRSEVASIAIQEGVSVINDISAGTEDADIFKVAATYHCPIILMHKQGTFSDMHQQTEYKNIVTDILDYFIQKIQNSKAFGIKDVIIDVGFGFSKTIEQNFELLKNLNSYTLLDKPILVGLSRKSMLYKALDITAAEALNATTAAHMVALQHGAAILRAHDVKEAVECIKIYNRIKKE